MLMALMKMRRLWGLIFLGSVLIALLAFVSLGILPQESFLKSRSSEKIFKEQRTSALPSLKQDREEQANNFSSNTQEGINSADIIKNAFVLYDGLSQKDKYILNHPKEEVDEEKAEALFKRIQPILALLHQAAQADYCDWGLGSVKFEQPATHLTKSAELGKLSLWAAGFQFPSNPEAALEYLADRNELGRAVGGNAMMGLIIETAMERSATQLMVQNAGSITPELASQYKELLNSSVLGEDASRAMDGELEGFNNEIKNLSAAESGTNGSEEGEGTGANSFKNFVQDPSHRSKIEQIRHMEKEFPKMIHASDAEFDQWMEGLNSVADDDLMQLLSQVLDLALRSVRGQLQKATIERSMLGAGIEGMQNGPGKLSSFLEPGTQMPFLYGQTPNGFELQSRAQFQGKPIILRFSNPGTSPVGPDPQSN